MASPFAIFRKNQKALMVAVTALAMFAFVILGSIESAEQMTTPLLFVMVIGLSAGVMWGFGYRSGKGNEWAVTGGLVGAAIVAVFYVFSGPSVYVYTNEGTLDRTQFRELVDQRRLVNQFVETVYVSTNPQPRVPDNLSGLPPQFLQQFMGPQIAEWERGLNAARFDYSTARTGRPAQSSQDFEADVAFGYVLSREADRLGIQVSDAGVTAFIKAISNSRLSDADFEQIRRRLDNVGKKQLYDALRNELRNRQAWELSRPQGFVTPSEYWSFYKRLTVEQRMELTAIPVEPKEFFPDGLEDPSNDELQQLFQQYAGVLPNQLGPGEPGFLQFPKARLGYFVTDFEKIEKTIPEPSEEDLLAYYEENKDPLYIKRDLPDDDDGPVLPPTTDGDDGEKPTTPDDSEGDKPDDDEPNEPKPDDSDDKEPKSDADGETSKPETTNPEPGEDVTPEEDSDTGDEESARRTVDGATFVSVVDDGEESSEPKPDAGDEPKDDEPKDDEPKDDEPKEDDPKDDDPKDDDPKDDDPKDDDPKDDDPKDDDPKEDDPKEDDPKEDDPKEDDPKDDDPKEDDPKEDDPKDGEPGDGEGPVIEPDEKEIEFEAFEDVREKVVTAVKRRRALAKIDELMDALRDAMSEAGSRYTTIALGEPDAMTHAELTKEMRALAKANGVVYRETPLLTPVDLRDSTEHSVGSASVVVRGGGEGQTVVDRVFGGDGDELAVPVRARNPFGVGGSEESFVFWILGQAPAHTPRLSTLTIQPSMTLEELAAELGYPPEGRFRLFKRVGELKTVGEFVANALGTAPKEGAKVDIRQFQIVVSKVSGDGIAELQVFEPGIRDVVLKAWRLRKTRPEAEKRAEALLAIAEKKGGALETSLEGQTVSGKKSATELSFTRTPDFRWLMRSSVPGANPLGQRSVPRISTIPGVAAVDNDFMKTVFEELGNGDVGVVPAADRSAYYVVRVFGRSPIERLESDTYTDEFLSVIQAEGRIPSEREMGQVPLTTYSTLAFQSIGSLQLAHARALELRYELTFNRDAPGGESPNRSLPGNRPPGPFGF